MGTMISLICIIQESTCIHWESTSRLMDKINLKRNHTSIVTQMTLNLRMNLIQMTPIMRKIPRRTNLLRLRWRHKRITLKLSKSRSLRATSHKQLRKSRSNNHTTKRLRFRAHSNRSNKVTLPKRILSTKLNKKRRWTSSKSKSKLNKKSKTQSDKMRQWILPTIWQKYQMQLLLQNQLLYKAKTWQYNQWSKKNWKQILLKPLAKSRKMHQFQLWRMPLKWAVWMQRRHWQNHQLQRMKASRPIWVWLRTTQLKCNLKRNKEIEYWLQMFDSGVCWLHESSKEMQQMVIYKQRNSLNYPIKWCSYWSQVFINVNHYLRFII